MDPFGFVILVGVLSVILVQYLAVRVGMARAKFKVPLPDQYTTDPEKLNFNCYQRAYANTIDNYALFLLLLFAGGDIFPLVGSAAGLLWIIGRVMYAHGYYTGNPQNRAKGWPAYIGLLTLLVSAIINGLDRLDLIDVR